MCALVEIDGLICTTQGELAEALNGTLVMDYGQQENDICLCPVNVRLTALQFNCAIDWDGAIWKLTPNDESNRTPREADSKSDAGCRRSG